MNDAGRGAQLALQAWLSPAYPVGAYAYSHGLESAVESGAVSDRRSLRDWLECILRHGAGRNDVILISETARCHGIANPVARASSLRDLAELAVALNTTAELRQESIQQGVAFLAVTRKAWPHAALEEFSATIGANTAYPVCFGMAVAVHGHPVFQASHGYLFAFVCNLLSAAVRLNVIGQTIAQEIAASLTGAIADITTHAFEDGIEALGSCAFVNDIASFRHEQQNARLFRS